MIYADVAIYAYVIIIYAHGPEVIIIMTSAIIAVLVMLTLNIQIHRKTH